MRHLSALGMVLLVAACGGGGSSESEPPADGGGGGAPPATFAVGGRILNLPGGLALTLDVAGQIVQRNASGAFRTAEPLPDGSAYVVRVTSPPLGRRCTVVNGEGRIAGSAVDDVVVDCGLFANAVPDGPVRLSAMSRRGDVVYVGGNFTRFGQFTGSLVATNRADGGLEAVGTPLAGVVEALVPDGTGGHFVVLRSRVTRSPELGDAQQLLRVGADGHVSSTFRAPSFHAYAAMTMAGGRLYVAGHARFSESASVVAVDVGTGASTAFAPVTTLGTVRAMHVVDGVLYMAGAMREVNGAARSGLAAVDAETGAVLPLAPEASSSGGLATMTHLAVAGHRLFVAGNFDVIGGVSRPGLAALETGSGRVLPWLPSFAISARPAVTDMVIASDGLWLAGGFEGHGTVVRVDPDTAGVFPWRVDVELVQALALSDDAVYLTGGFQSVAGQPRGGLAAVRRSDGALLPYGADQLDWGARHVSVAGEVVWIGGSFQVYGGARRPGLAAVRVVDGALTPWAPDFSFEGRSADIYGVVDTDAGVLVAGQFTDVGGSARQGLALVDGDSGATLPWTSELAGGEVMHLASTTSRVYVGGMFSALGGQSRSNLAAFDRQTMALTDWAPLARPIRALAANDAAVFAADVGGLVAFDPATGAQTAWRPSLRAGTAVATADSIVAAEDRVHVQGGFDEAAGQRTLRGHATLAADTGAFLYSPVEPVHRFVVGPGGTYVLQQVTDASGITTSRISVLDGSGVIGTPLWSIDGLADTVVFGSGAVVVGGDIGRAGVPIPYLLLVPGG